MMTADGYRPISDETAELLPDMPAAATDLRAGETTTAARRGADVETTMIGVSYGNGAPTKAKLRTPMSLKFL
ncbi:hypothetical protein KHC28_05990 [Ancylobacter sonchi]|uniref:hypothetical protein n=1 Tax=Ancylobacter sonchi TaxID=1937790 RepID=UPI001BD5C929|nr:hypothetical protein [Ancylobacter sonchi]MBS7533210.1 hypothetical protein [Ancylobacter sonchi]